MIGRVGRAQAGTVGMAAIAFCSALAGCADRLGLEPIGYSVRKLPDVSRAEALQAAIRTVREFYGLEHVDERAGLVQARPQERTERGATGRLRDLLGPTSSRIRRMAMLRIDSRPDGLYGLSRVVVQRLATAELQALAGQRRFADAPTDTPIDQDLGVRPNRREGWTEIGRDRIAERRLLQALYERLTAGQQAGTQPSSRPAGSPEG